MMGRGDPPLIGSARFLVGFVSVTDPILFNRRNMCILKWVMYVPTV